MTRRSIPEREPGRQTTLWVGALRYYMGRQTYAVGNFCDLLLECWPHLDSSVRSLIQRDLEKQFELDDQERAKGEKRMRWLGADCDRKQWEKVRALWRE